MDLDEEPDADPAPPPSVQSPPPLPHQEAAQPPPVEERAVLDALTTMCGRSEHVRGALKAWAKASCSVTSAEAAIAQLARDAHKEKREQLDDVRRLERRMYDHMAAGEGVVAQIVDARARFEAASRAVGARAAAARAAADALRCD